MSSKTTRRQRSLRLSLEALEDRQLLDAGGLTPPLASLAPFPSIADFDKHFVDQAVTQYGSLFGTNIPAPIPYWPAYSPVVSVYSPLAANSIIYPGIGYGR